MDEPKTAGHEGAAEQLSEAQGSSLPPAARPDNGRADVAASAQDHGGQAADRPEPLEEEQGRSSPWADVPAAPSDAELARLRELLFTRELALLDKIQASLDSSRYNTQKVSKVIAEAILLRSEKDDHLNVALEPVVADIVRNSLHKRPTDFVNALFPLMGPSIRKSISESFNAMLGSFSKSMEMAFSWKGLRWRAEALRSGQPFSEVVMLHTLVYRVEQIFFIHSDTGLVLSHLIHEGAGAQDADMVSAMLTAIQDFARDCFTSGNESDLEALRLGEFTIFIEKLGPAYIACVVRGTPPPTLHEQLRSTLELMLGAFAEDLGKFDGDTSHFEGAARYLETCMVSSYVDDDKKLPLWAKALPVCVVLLVVGVFAFFKIQATHFADTRESALGVMRSEPGLMVINVSENRTPPWDAVVLKDALAVDPTVFLQERNFSADLFNFKVIPFISYDPSIVAERVESEIKLPDTVTMRFDKGTLYLKGTAPMRWIVEARERARSLPGVESIDIRELSDPNMAQVTAWIKEVESAAIEFPLGGDLPVPADQPKLQHIADILVSLEKTAKEMGFDVTLTIYGHADTTGGEKRNYEISQARTRTVAALLSARGSSMPIAMYGMGSQYPKNRGDLTEEARLAHEDQASRRIELRVHLARSVAPDSDAILP